MTDDAYITNLLRLADIADPDQLWRLPAMGRRDWAPEKRDQLDAGVALSRFASHLRHLQEAREAGRSVLITPYTTNSSARLTVDTPLDHAKMRGQMGCGPLLADD